MAFPVHLYADDLSIMITASPWWCGQKFSENMKHLAQHSLKQLQDYANT